MDNNDKRPTETDQLKLILEETKTALATMLTISEQMDLKLTEMGEDGNPNTEYHTDVLNMWSKLNKTISATQKIIENAGEEQDAGGRTHRQKTKGRNRITKRTKKRTTRINFRNKIGIHRQKNTKKQ
jgi:hypothetical protein